MCRPVGRAIHPDVGLQPRVSAPEPSPQVPPPGRIDHGWCGRQDGDISRGDDQRVAVVLPGAVARGALPPGALGHILSRLPAESQPSIILGTSAGAINAVLRSRHRNDDPAVTAAAVKATWRRISNNRGIAPPAGKGLRGPSNGSSTRQLGGFSGHGLGIRTLLDTAPSLTGLAEDLRTTTYASHSRAQVGRSRC